MFQSQRPVKSQLQPDQYLSTPALTRYFDHIQNSTPVRSAADALAPAFAPVAIDLSSAPPVTRAAPETKKKDKKDKEATPAPTEAAPAATVGKEQPAAAAPKKEKREKKDKVAPADGGADKKKGCLSGLRATGRVWSDGDPLPGSSSKPARVVRHAL